MTPYGPAMPAAGPKPPGPSLRLSIVLMVIGGVVGVGAAVAGIAPIATALQGFHFDVPNTVVVHLGKGDYLLYERTGGFLSSNTDVTIRPSQVTVTNRSTLEKVPVDFPGGATIEHIPSNDASYTGAVEFTAPAAGDYVISVQTATKTSVLVAHPLTRTVRRVLGWLALAGIGGITFITGTVLLIVGVVRRGRMRTVAYAFPASPAGWYPDPSGSGRLRYWDGARWTEHLH